MYSIVVFTEKNETEVIPSDWLSIDKKISFWPPYNSTKCRKAVEKNETPDEEWNEYITEWVAEYDSYEKARRKLVKFCKGNSLESTDEDSVRKRVPSSKYVNGFTSGRPPVQASTSWLHTETMERPKKKNFCSNGAKRLKLPAIPPFAPSAPAMTVPEPRQDDAAKKQGAKVVEAEEKIKTWLKYSGDRNGGRKKRATEKEKQKPQADSSSCESE
ncbi:uncharacterized protein LOC113092451 [Carassius auratus]|uniref:Uncharacterized protein LOC113040937 isoform X2 n=1 Tax=Carassius auratus TaxID=7957 RepID=A0A6P6J6B1_CARAU|nr:uncharacterized protein LOC113040937 isoform X2 [Carassius auratus]XP_026113835.1 uncharacterized protein LOC113092451 [Carassius auratus]XP_052394861.1 uncharacterized protein LOC127942888 [Carassius gibelio]